MTLTPFETDLLIIALFCFLAVGIEMIGEARASAKIRKLTRQVQEWREKNDTAKDSEICRNCGHSRSAHTATIAGTCACGCGRFVAWETRQEETA